MSVRIERTSPDGALCLVDYDTDDVRFKIIVSGNVDEERVKSIFLSMAGPDDCWDMAWDAYPPQVHCRATVETDEADFDVDDEPGWLNAFASALRAEVVR